MKKQLSLMGAMLLCSFVSYAQIDCGWTDSTETSFEYPAESSACGSSLDDYIPSATDSILTVRLAIVISQDQNGDSPFSDNLVQDSTDFFNAISFMNGNCFDNIPAPAVANPNPTSVVSDTRIRFVLSRFFYRTADSAGNNVVSSALVKNSLPEAVRGSHLIVNYSSKTYNHGTPKPTPWGESYSSKYVTMWEHSTAWGIALLAHELGHSLSLGHTFHKNSFGNGDGIDDTPDDIFAQSATACAPAPANCVCPPTTPYPGNICPDNFMGYGQQNWWSPRQVARMRRHLYTAVPEILQADLPASAPTTFRTITASETWTDGRFVYQNIRVQSGVILTISGAVVLAKDVVIEVEPGAELVLNCATLSAGEDWFWGGIRLLGDNTQPQTLQYQSKLTVDNSTLERATDAIMNGGVYNCAILPSGAIIEVNNSLFMNNLRHVALSKYDRGSATGHWLADWVDYKASFQNTSFIRDANFTNPDDLYRGAAISLWGVHGVIFDNCEIQQQQGDRDLTGSPNEGIYMLDASLHMNNSEVKYYRYGLRSQNTGPFLKGSTLYKNRFQHNRYTVYLAGSHLNEVVDNFFFVPKDLPGVQGPGGVTDLPYGLYLHGTGMFRVEENLLLNAPSLHYSNDPAATNVAIAVHNNGDFSDVLYRNTLSNFGNIGLQASGQNRDATGLNGLQCRCSAFNTLTDIHVRGTLGNSLDGVRNNQGNGGTNPDQEDMAGNLFSTNASHLWAFRNELTPNINYHHHDKTSSTRVEPNPRQGVLAFEYTDIDYGSNSCPTQLLILPEGDTLAEMDYPFSVADIDFTNYTGKSDSLRSLLDDLIDGGNTWQLQAEIYFTPEHEYYQLYLDMMNQAPYLSRTVLSDLIALDGLDELMLRNILVAHPQVAKDATLLDQLATDRPGMPQYMVDDIMKGIDQFGTKEVMEGTLSAYRQKQYRAAHRLLDIYTTDPAYSSEALTAVRSIFDAMPFAGFQYMRVQMELDLGNVSTAQNVLDNIPNVVPMNDDETDRHNHVVDYFDVTIDMAQNGQEWCEVDGTVLNELQSMSGVHHPAGAWARAALALREQTVNYQEPLYLPSAGSAKRSTEHQYPQVERPTARIYPNPSRGMVTFDLGELPLARELTLSVHDLNGKAVKTLNLNGQSTVIDLRGLPAGVYLLSVDGDTNRIFEDKLLLFD